MADCIATIRREFYMQDTGEHDGGETEFFYEYMAIAEPIKACNSIEEVRELFGPQDNEVFRIIITEAHISGKGKFSGV